MEKEYMLKIWEVIASKDNQNLSVKEQQDKIELILTSMNNDVQVRTKNKFRKDCLKTIEESLKSL